MIKVSILIIAYNAKQYIPATLDSCIHQTYSNTEIIVVDDGSLDGTADIIKNYALRDSRIRYIYQKNSGPVLARKRAMAEVGGEYFFFLDADDTLPLNSIHALVAESLRSNSDIVLGRTQHLKENGDFIGDINYIPLARLNVTSFLSALVKTGQGHIWGLLIKSNLISSVTYYPQNVSLGEDLILLLQLIKDSSLISKTETIIYNYYYRDNSMINSKIDIDKEVFRAINLIRSLYVLINSNIVRAEHHCFLKQMIINHVYNTSSTEVTLQILKKEEKIKNLLLSYSTIKEIFFKTPKLYLGMIRLLVKSQITA